MKVTDRDDYNRFDFERANAEGNVPTQTKRRKDHQSKKSIAMDGLGCTVLKQNKSNSSKEMVSDSVTKND